LIYFTKKYYRPSIKFKIKISSKLKFFIRKLLPSIFSSGVTQINILIGTIIASFESGAVSYLYYADRVYQINLAIAGIAVGTVSLPILSKAVKNNNINKVSSIQNRSLELSMLLSIPACFGIIIASEQIINALFGYGSFLQEDVITTSQALKFFGYGIPAFALIKVLSNFFFARDNTLTPFHISLLTVFLNIIISLSFFKNVGFIIIPIATSISTWIGVIIYILLLKKRKYLIFKNYLLKSSFKIILCTIFMSLILLYGLDFFRESLHFTNKFKSIYLIFIVSFAATIYFVTCYLIGILKLKNYKIN